MAVSVENQVLIETEVQKLYKKYPLSITSQCRTGVSKHLISCTEKGGGGGASCSKFETSKSEDSLRTFQDGGNPYVTGPVKKEDYLVKIDLKDAYLTVPIWHKHQKYLRFLWKDNM